MPNYRRFFVPGGCWFFTVNLADRNSQLLVDHIDDLREAVRATRRRFPFEIDAMVVLPDHVHAVWTLPIGDTDFPQRWRLIKQRFSKAVPLAIELTPVQQRRGERDIWQRRYWEHLIRDERDHAHHIEYCWYNPVRHGLVARVEEWPYSTLHRDMKDEFGKPDFEAFARGRDEAANRRRYGER